MDWTMKTGLRLSARARWSWTAVAVLCALGPIRSTHAIGRTQPPYRPCEAARAVLYQGPIVPRLPGAKTVRELHDRDKGMHWALRRVLVKRGAPGLDRWLGITRERLLAAGARSVPEPLVTRFATAFRQGLLRRARYIVSGELFEAVRRAPFRFDDADAVTIVDVIVFRDGAAAGRELSWVRELARIRQFERWGVDAFAQKYLESWRRLDWETRRVVAKYVASAPGRPWPGVGVPGDAPDAALASQSNDRMRTGGCRDTAALK